MSGIFMPCTLVRQFHVRNFHVQHFQRPLLLYNTFWPDFRTKCIHRATATNHEVLITIYEDVEFFLYTTTQQRICLTAAMILTNVKSPHLKIIALKDYTDYNTDYNTIHALHPFI